MAASPLKLRRLLWPHWKPLAVAFAAMLLTTAADLLEPWPLKIVFDHVIGSRPNPPWLTYWPAVGGDPVALLNGAAIAVVAIAALGAIGSYWEKYLSTTVGQRVMHDLRHMLYDHVHRLSLSFFEGRPTGDLIVRLTSDIDAVQDVISSALLGIVLDVMTLLGMVAIMLYLEPTFALIALSTTPVLFVVVYRLTRRIKSAAREVKRKESNLASVVQESISSVRVVRAFGAEAFEQQRFDHESEASVAAALQARRFKARLAPSVDLIVAVGTCLVLLFGVRLVLSERLTAGALLVFVVYLGKMYKPMKNLSKMTDTLSKASVGIERICELMETESQVRDRPGAVVAPPLIGRIQFDGVGFEYVPGQHVLRDVSLAIEPGQAAALVGPTGSGKSTMFGLIARFYDVNAGQIRIDGRDVRDYTLASLRAQISIVPQDPVLFRLPIWQNIAYGLPHATRDDIVRAAKIANAHGFIQRLPQGYETVIGERGDTLSGGERQRIAIARAVVRDAPILLLDEPSASLDAESEELIFEALGRLMRGRTSLTIAHRLATIQRAKVIFVLDKGVIVERGTHDSLLASGGLYSRLHAIQFHGRELGRAAEA